MTVTFHAAWMLCALASIVFAAAAAASGRQLAALAGGFAVAVAAVRLAGPPEVGIIGAMAAGAALACAIAPRYRTVGAAAGGAVAGMWPSLLEGQGLPWSVAVAVAGSTVVMAAWLSRVRPRFAPERIREEGLLIVLASAFVVMALPTVLDGWQSAITLTAQPDDPSAAGVPLWTLTIVASSIAFGGLYSLWSRR